jgi:hypothetical protein
MTRAFIGLLLPGLASTASAQASRSKFGWGGAYQTTCWVDPREELH